VHAMKSDGISARIPGEGNCGLHSEICPFKSNSRRVRALKRWRVAVSEQTRTTRSRRRQRSKPTQERFVFPNGWGGRRKGSGQKRRGERANVSHRTRASLADRLPVEVTMRVKPGLPSLRGLREFEALRGAIAAGCERDGFRLVHFSVQSHHLHLIVEGDSRATLTRGMQGLAIRIARALNRLRRRVGSVFADRYHDRILQSPREVWNALRYVLCNARKHGAWTSAHATIRSHRRPGSMVGEVRHRSLKCPHQPAERAPGC